MVGILPTKTQSVVLILSMSHMMPKIYNSGYGYKTTQSDSTQRPRRSKSFRRHGTK